MLKNFTVEDTNSPLLDVLATSTSNLTSSATTTPNATVTTKFPNMTMKTNNNAYTGINCIVGAPSFTSSLLSRKRHLEPDDKLAKSRERNRMHARKTRERKKNQMNALQQRIEDLHAESKELRLKIDERYTARLLIGLTTNYADMDDCKSSAMLCTDSYSSTTDWFRDETAIPYQKRVRSPGKYTQLERETFRRERNRMHAKRTRDRKKMFFEISEKVITKMENEVSILRNYLVSVNMMSPEERKIGEDRDKNSRVSLAMLKNGGDPDSANFTASVADCIAAGRSFDADDDDEDDDDEDDDEDDIDYNNEGDKSNDSVQVEHIIDGVVVDNDEQVMDGDDIASNNDSSQGSGSPDGSNGGTSHESSGSSSSVTLTSYSSENGVENEMRLGDDDSENNDVIEADADASFQVKDINSANFVNKSTLEALNASQAMKSFTGFTG